MTFKMKTSAIALVLLGATALSSCSTWYPGKGYKLYKSHLLNNISEKLETLGVDNYLFLRMDSCFYLQIVGKGNQDPAAYKYTFGTILYEVKYTYTYELSGSVLTVSETDYANYKWKSHEIEFIDTDGQTEYKNRKEWLEKGYVYGCIGQYDYRNL